MLKTQPAPSSSSSSSSLPLALPQNSLGCSSQLLRSNKRAGGKAAVRPGSRLWLGGSKQESRRNFQVCDNPLYPHTPSHRGRKRKRRAGKNCYIVGRGLARSECVTGEDLGTESAGLDLSQTLGRMEVASALLEASKKISADSSTNTSCSATATWSSSISEVGFAISMSR